MTTFSQPQNEIAPAPAESPSISTLVSLAATLAHRDGNPEAIEAQLGADPAVVAQFKMAYQVQGLTVDEGASRVQRRTQEEVEKRRASFQAYEQFIAEEEVALRAATDEDADKFGKTLTTMELDDIPEPEFLVDGFFSRNSVAQLFGPPKSFKSFIILDVAGCIGSGIPWQGKQTQSAKVLYIVAEGAGGIKRRVRAWEELNKRPMVGVEFYPKAVQLSSRAEIKALIAYTKRHGFGMVIFDTQARACVGIEENSNTDMGRVVAALDSLKETSGACIVLVHHSGADGSKARGATAVLGAVDSQFMLRPNKDKMSVELITTAQKDTGEHETIEMDLVTPGPGHALAVKARLDWYKGRTEDLAPLPQREQEILTVLSGFGDLGATMAVLGKAFPNTDPLDLRRAAGTLDKKECIKLKGAAMYVAPLGRKHLDRAAQQLPEDH